MRSRIIGIALVLALGAAACRPHPGGYHRVRAATIADRLRRYAGDDAARQASLAGLFEEAGCRGDRLELQPVDNADAPNVICTLPGETDGVLVVGAHFDRVDVGDGVADNWSGASLLPSLYQSLGRTPRRHTFLFIGFSDEEEGYVGSKFYADTLDAARRASIRAMVNLDTLGLTSARVWERDSSPPLVELLHAVARARGLPLDACNIDDYGDSDGSSFKKHGIPVLTLHSVTPGTWDILHSEKDRFAAVGQSDYYDTYNLVAAFLAALDAAPPAGAEGAGPGSTPPRDNPAGGNLPETTP